MTKDLLDQQEPSEEDQKKLEETILVGEVYEKYDTWRDMRKPYEIQWYMNAAALRGFPDARYNQQTSMLEVLKEPKHRKRTRVNLIKPKWIARVSKFTQVIPNPIVIPATTDRDDILNAQASQKALEYAARKLNLSKKYTQAMRWVPLTGKAFFVVRWDDEAQGKQQIDGQTFPADGDIALDFCSAFELLVSDPSVENLGQQPEIMRVRLVKTKDILSKYPEIDSLGSDSSADDVFYFQRQIADLGSRGQSAKQQQDTQNANDYVMRLELFTKPNSKYPNGRYVVCAGRKILRYQEELPGKFNEVFPDNPYPIIEFADDLAPGQFYPDAYIERLVGLNAEYNDYRSRIRENIALHTFPKLMVPKQANLHPDAYTSESGEKIEFTALPGIQGPYFLQPSGVLGDLWNLLNLHRREFDDVSMIYPSSLGATGQATSGYQSAILQEAADAVHGPAIRNNAHSLHETFIKLRRLMKIGYDVPRLVSIAGKSNIPQVTEFSAESIDENADVIIEPDSMMPTNKAARLDMIRGMFKDGLFGNPGEPKTQKKVSEMLRMGWSDFELDKNIRDEQQALVENVKMIANQELPKPAPWENHEVHWESHIDLFKSPESERWTEQQLVTNVWHALIHLNYLDPNAAMMMSQEYGLAQQMAELQAAMQPQSTGAPLQSPAPEQAGPQLEAPPQMGEQELMALLEQGMTSTPEGGM
jgi:hypothetical protein